MVISHGKLVRDTMGAVLRVGVPKAAWEIGLEQVEDKSEKASLRKQHLWWNLIVAYALVKFTKEEELTFPSEGKMCVQIQSCGRLGGFGRIAILKLISGQTISVKSVHMERCQFMKCCILDVILRAAESY